MKQSAEHEMRQDSELCKCLKTCEDLSDDKCSYIGRFSGIAQHRVRTLVNRFCKPVDIKLVFSTFKIKNLFNVKDSLPDRLRTRVVYKFSCASCNACYIGETSRHFATCKLV